MATKLEVLRANLTQWLATKRYSKERALLRDHLATTLRIHPNSVGRAMRRVQTTPRNTVERRGRPRVYTKDVDAALHAIWDAMDKPCAEVLHPMVGTYVRSLVHHKKWCFGDHAQTLMHAMSVGTIKERIGSWREKEGGVRGYSATVPSPLKDMIPIRKSHTWHTLPAGYLQMDTVVHCGDLLTSDVVYSVGCVDFRTYWAEYTAQWNKGQEATRESIERITDRMPFSVHEIHPDTGNEFVNHLVKHWADAHSIDMTRSEPYKKNDNMCIEERNNTIPRRHLGYARMDDRTLVPLAMRILMCACTIHNHFRPVRRMTDKVRIGARWHRTYERKALTPYERVLACDTVTVEMKHTLRARHTSLDPLSLQGELDTLKNELSKELTKRIARRV